MRIARLNPQLQLVNPSVPVIPPLTEDEKRRRDNPNGPVAQCGQCGLELMAVMGYVCQDPYCPVFSRTTC